ncbi:MAG TPA: hypothetical protein DDY68_01545 [Porphyromonadaceae bacterium]|nr:hypothetical protein [Porphyromonadaceae bacterium]
MNMDLSVYFPKEMCWLDLFSKGCGLASLLVLLFCILLCVGIYKWIVLRNATQSQDDALAKIKDYLFENRIDSAKKLCSGLDSPMGNILKVGIANLDKPVETLSTLVRDAGNKEINRFDKGLPFISLIASIAPLMGILGAVVEMMGFSLLVSKMMCIEGAIKAFSFGMYWALAVIVVGLIVGLFARLVFVILSASVNRAENEIEYGISNFMSIIQSPSYAKVGVEEHKTEE